MEINQEINRAQSSKTEYCPRLSLETEILAEFNLVKPRLGKPSLT